MPSVPCRTGQGAAKSRGIFPATRHILSPITPSTRPPWTPFWFPGITWRYGMQRILYSDMKYWTQNAGPVAQPCDLSGFLCSGGVVLNGEGSLIYPGSRVRRYTGQRNVDRPVSSIRFELLRE